MTKRKKVLCAGFLCVIIGICIFRQEDYSMFVAGVGVFLATISTIIPEDGKKKVSRLGATLLVINAFLVFVFPGLLVSLFGGL